MSLPYIPFHSKPDEPGQDDTQARQYLLLDNLQKLVQKLPMNMQQRLPYSLLSDIAAALLDEAIFTIVGDLQEIQHLTEKNLNAQRQKLLQNHKGLKQELRTKHKSEMQTCRPHNVALMKSQHEQDLNELNKRLQVELQQMDMRLLNELDEKVAAQQVTMQSAGMPGFFVTNDPKEIKLQMTILQLVTNLSNQV